MKIYEVSGNRFILGEEDVDVVEMCNKYECDGYLQVCSHQLSVYNKDGSKANLCINGLHCFTQYLYDKDGIYYFYALVIENMVYKSEIISVEPFISKVTIKYPNIYRNYVYLGNDHMILLDEKYENAAMLCERYDCNINYVNVINRKCIEVKTYERGVGFTASCGSGNVSSVAYCYENDLCDKQVDVINEGGICSVEIYNQIEITSMSSFVEEI